MRFKKMLQEPGARRTTAWHHHGSDRPTSARAVLHHTDPNGPNILKGSVLQTIYVLKTEILHFLSLKSAAYKRERHQIKSGL